MKKKLIPILFFLIFVIFGAVVGYMLTENKNFSVSPLAPLLALLAFFTAFLFQIIIHEAGHFIFGKLSGMRFYSFRIGFVALELENANIRFKYYKNLGYLGLCIMLPTRPNMAPRSLILYMAGGLIMNMLCFIISLFLIFSGQLAQGYLIYFTYSTAFIAMVLFLTNAWPMKNEKNITTDGKYIIDALRGHPNSKHLADLFSINAWSFRGENPSLFYPPYLNRHHDIDAPFIKVNFLIYDYYYYLHENELLKAVEAIEELTKHLDDYPKVQLKEMQKELLFVSSFLKPNLDKAMDLHHEVKKGLAAGGTVNDFRISAAYALCVNQDRIAALKLIKMGRAVTDTYIMKSFIPLEKRLLDELEAIALHETANKCLI